jgi:hypothetical protein
MAFTGTDTTRSEIVINNKIIEQVNIFNYLEIWYHMRKKNI